MNTPEQWDAVIADLRRPGGWTKHQYGYWRLPEGAVCLAGALMRHHCGARVALLDIVTEQFPNRPNHSVTAFNDHPATTVEDVLLVCEKMRASLPSVGKGAPKL